METGLYYYRARYYSPTLGRFLQTDPIGGNDDLNEYAYTGGDPLNNDDPTGQASCSVNGGSSTDCGNVQLISISRSPFWSILLISTSRRGVLEARSETIRLLLEV